jgi:hypothetical protein
MGHAYVRVANEGCSTQLEGDPMETLNPTLMMILSIAYVVFFLALLYIIGGIGDNIKKIRQMIEQELKK